MLQSPLHPRFAASDALLIPYGVPGNASEVVGAFEEVGLEYAAIRKSAVLFDEPHVGTLIIRGNDRLTFLNNMITQKVIDLAPGRTRWSFWLNRKGRLDAELRLVARDDHLLVWLDRHLAEKTAESLTGFVFSEDVIIENASDRLHRMSIHGRTALSCLAHHSASPALSALEPTHNTAATMAGVPVTVDRDDLTGEPGLALSVPRDHAEQIHDILIAPGPHPAKPCGWFAVNTARIEAGRPLFNIDYGHDNLPAETGVTDTRIDYRKGCYLGQEVVARMDARKTRKQGLVALRTLPPAEGHDAPLPSAGDRVFTADDAAGNPIGTVTSSTISPMLSGNPACFAMIRDAETTPATELIVQAEGQRARAVVQPTLTFWPLANNEMPLNKPRTK